MSGKEVNQVGGNWDRTLASALRPADTETALATLAEIWTEYRSLDRNEILSARQRQVLNRLGSLCYGDEEEL